MNLATKKQTILFRSEKYMELPETLLIVTAGDNDSGNEEVLEIPQNNRPWKYDYTLKVGDNDINDNKIEYIYEKVPGKYFIYHIGDFDLQFVAEDETIISKDSKFNRLWLQIADYLSNDKSLRKPYITHLAYAIKNLHDGSPDSAYDALTSTYDGMTRQLKRRAVLPYLFGASTLVLISLITYFAVYKYGDLNVLGHIIFCAVVFSGLGGFLSIAISLRNLNVDVQDGFYTKAVFGFIRIAIAMISGVAVYYLIESNIALTFIKELKNINAFYAAFFIAGFIEKLVSNLMLGFEDKAKPKA